MTALRESVTPDMPHLPEHRLRQVSVPAIRGILAAQSPALTAMARGGQPEDALNWPLAKRCYRFVANTRFDDGELFKGQQGIARRAVARTPLADLAVAIAPPTLRSHTEDMEGVSTVLKSTPGIGRLGA